MLTRRDFSVYLQSGFAHRIRFLREMGTLKCIRESLNSDWGEFRKSLRGISEKTT